MSSFVYFKFKSQKEPTRISFDGPFIQVWDLKREIIHISRLGDGSDFDLKIYNEANEGETLDSNSHNPSTNTTTEYTDDTDLIHKDSTVLARRLPAAIPGKGRAARYVSGKPPVNARAQAATMSKPAGKVIDMNNAQTEEERVKAMFSLNTAQWQQKQEEMANETRVPIQGQKPFNKKQNIPEGEPPHGYICYRCGKKGHWIQACPTNDDPNYENKNRIKRTTGIPRSMLKKIDQEEFDNLDDAQRQNLMVNADGEYVFAQADEKAWKQHLERVKAAGDALKAGEQGDKELQARGLECALDKRMFVNPMKTPCCGKTYCNDCIENALLESDLTCPGCETENVSLERLESDTETILKIKEYQDEKAEKKASSPYPSPKSPEEQNRASTKSPTSESGAKSKKRTASDVTDKSQTQAAPAMKRQKSGESANGSKAGDRKSTTPVPATATPAVPSFMPPDMTTMMQNMNMPFPFSMPMPGMPFMPGMMNPMMGMPNMNFPNFGMPNNNMNGMQYPNMMGNNFSNMNGNGNFGQHNQHQNGNQNRYQTRNHFQPKHTNTNIQPTGLQGVPTGPKAMVQGQSQGPVGVPTGPKFANQQRYQGKEEDNAYMRQPVNPHRHQGKGKKGRVREADYREL
jgi:protein MPE1